MVIPANFERADHFSEGFAAVRLNGCWGYVDTQGELKIPAHFDAVGPFHQGLAEVIFESRAGVIDRTGSFIISPNFARAVPWTEHVVLAQELDARNYTNHIGVHPLGGLVGQFGYPKEMWFRFGLYSTQGRWLYPQVLGRALAVQSGKVKRLWTVESASGNWGLMAPDGTWIIEPSFSEVRVTRTGLSVVNEGNRADRKYGALRADGTWLLEPGSYPLLMTFDPYVLVFDGRQKGLIDDSGRLIGGRMFDRIDVYDTDGIYIVSANGMTQGLDRSGELIPDPRVGQPIKECPNGLRLVSDGDKKRILKANGEIAVPYEVDLWDIQCDRPTPIKIADKWTYLYPSGALMHDPAPFDSAYGFIDAYACVREHGLWGVIDESGDYIISPRYEALSPDIHHQTLGDRLAGRSIEQPQGLFKAQHQGRTFAVGTDGVERDLPQQALKKLDRVPLPNRTTLIHKDGLWGIDDEDGRVIVPPIHRALDIFSDGIAWIAVDERKMWIPIGPDGQPHAGKPAPRAAHFPYINCGNEPKKLHEEPYESSVLWARWWLEALAGQRADDPPMS